MAFIINGKVVANNKKITKATEDASGIIQIATNDDIIFGLDNSKAVTPKQLALKANRDDVYTKSEIDSKIGSALNYRGSVNSYSDLPKTNNNQGDVYNVLDTGANYAYTGTDWDKLSETIDLSGYLTKDEINESYQTKSDAQIKYVYLSQIKADISSLSTVATSGNFTDLHNIPNYLTEESLASKGYLTSIPDYYITETELSNKGYLTEHQDISNLASKNELLNKQDTLIAGDNITIENNVISSSYINNKVLSEESSINLSYPIHINNSFEGTTDKCLITTEISANPATATIKANHGKFGKQLSSYKYNQNENPNVTYAWHKIFESSNLDAVANFDISVVGYKDNSCCTANYKLNIINYKEVSTCITLHNVGFEGSESDLIVAVDSLGNVYISSNACWATSYLMVNNCLASSNAVIPFENMGYGSWKVAVGFEAKSIIENCGTIQLNKSNSSTTIGTTSIKTNIDGCASNAIKDGNGNVIVNTYATKTELNNKRETINNLASSGTISLSNNSVNRINITGNVTFNLPTNVDSSILNQIMIQITMNSVKTINVGTTQFFGGKSPDLSKAGKYNMIYEHDGTNWVCGVMVKASA